MHNEPQSLPAEGGPDKPRLSAVLSVFNGERYLASAVQSVLAQTYREFELLAIDDGSTDGSLRVLEAFQDPRMRILRNERNRGLVASLNRGLREAHGEYVARVDADDRSHPERFAKQVEFLDRNPDVVLVGTRARWIDDRDRIANGEGILMARDLRPTAHDEIFAALLQKNPFMHSSVMYRRGPVQALGGYDPTARHAEDYALWLRLAESYRVANLAEELVDYRVHAEQVSRRHIGRQRRVADRLRQQAYLRRRASGELPSHAPSPLPSWRDRLNGRSRTLGGDYVAWIETYRLLGRDDLARSLVWPGLAAAPLSEYLRDRLLEQHLSPRQLAGLRKAWRAVRALLIGG